MKKVEAIFKPFKLNEIKDALSQERIQRFSVLEFKRVGSDQTRVKQYRGATYARIPASSATATYQPLVEGF